MFIYKITNKINGKSYIGQTSNSLSIRFKHHCRKSSNCVAINSAIQKYGAVNFIIEEIGGANSQSELNYLEKMLIIKYSTLSPNGYNLRHGGESGGKLSNETKRKMSISKLGKKHSTKSKINMSLGSTGQKGGMSSKNHNLISNIKNSISNGGKPFIVKNYENKIIWSGLIISQCARDLNLSVGNISECLHGKRLTHNGYRFSYEVVNGK